MGLILILFLLLPVAAWADADIYLVYVDDVNVMELPPYQRVGDRFEDVTSGGVGVGDFSRPAMPNLTALADAGVIFQNVHVGLRCSVGRGMLYTGVPTHRPQNLYGFNQNSQLPTPHSIEASHGHRNLWHRMHDAGYVNVFYGKWHAGPEQVSNGHASLISKWGIDAGWSMPASAGQPGPETTRHDSRWHATNGQENPVHLK